jgi:actin-related protein 6
MSWSNNPNKIICVDNGGYNIKYSNSNENTPISILQNCKFNDKGGNMTSSENFISHVNYNKENISYMKNFSRPLSRGLLNDIDLEIDIWSNMFTHLNKLTSSNPYGKQYNSYSYDKFDFKDNMFMFSYTPLSPDNIMDGYFQMLFEYFDFNAVFKAMPHYFSAINATNNIPELNKSVQLVIDSGFSSTTIVPILNNRPVYNAIKRIDVGGKLLTNYLKDALGNLTDLDLRKDFYLVNLIKEELCFVSKNFTSDMKISGLKGESNINKRDFILPEYRKKSEEQLLKVPKDRYTVSVNSLRFIIPEILFNPSLIGIDEGGLQEGIAQSVKDCNEDYRNLLFENIILTGGNCCFPNFVERLSHELLPNSDYDSEINIHLFNESKKNNSLLKLDNSNEKYSLKFNNTTDKTDFVNYSVIDGMKKCCENIDVIKEFSISKADYEEIGFNIFWKSTI